MIKSYKGFNENMTCNPTLDISFQYEEGKIYEEESAVICEKGFHACEYPLDCFSYYDPAHSVFHEVEQSGEISKMGIDSKVASSKIKIGAKINIAGLVKAAIEYTKERTKSYREKTVPWDHGASSVTGIFGASSATGDRGTSSATGDRGASSAKGIFGASSATGDQGVSSTTGYGGASSATGLRGASSATGFFGASSATGVGGASSATGLGGASCATGDRGASSATGLGGASSATGDRGASSATGIFGASSATGVGGASSVSGKCGASSVTGYKGRTIAGDPESVAVAWGYNSMAKGVIGSFLVFADWECVKEFYLKQSEWSLKGAKLVQVDGEKIKPDTWYTIEKGEIKEAEE